MTVLTVLIPARNAERTLKETLDSLAAQTFSDFDILLIDDASSDRTSEIARSYGPQLRLVNLGTNHGVARSLNHGLAQIGTPYIARLDADDIALPTRFEQQIRFLEAHPDIDVCGTAMEVFFDGGGHPPSVLAKPAGSAAIHTALIQYTALSHPSVMLRKRFVEDVGCFDTRFDFAEDYDLWCRGALLGKKYANLQDVLVRYRQHQGQVSHQKRQLQCERDLAIRRRYITALLGGDAPGYLAELFTLGATFTSREMALAVITQSMPLLLRLGKRVLDEPVYAEILSGTLSRHLK